VLSVVLSVVLLVLLVLLLLVLLPLWVVLLVAVPWSMSAFVGEIDTAASVPVAAEGVITEPTGITASIGISVSTVIIPIVPTAATASSVLSISFVLLQAVLVVLACGVTRPRADSMA
jgi:hypothetical protein